MKRWLALALCAACSAAGMAQGTDEGAIKARLDQVAQSYAAMKTFMGTVLVVEGDRVLLDKGYGMADLEWGNANAPDVKFRLGSLTKQFTATLVLLLEQDGKLRIDDPVNKYLPNTPKAWEKITLANLLGHTSGIPDFTQAKEFDVWRMSPHTHEEELAFFRDKPLDFEPGSRFAYSNSNYEVLGVVSEQVSGRQYADLLRERICDPLGMKDTGLDTDELILPRRAQGYMQGKDALVPARSESMTVPWAAGSLYSTTGDLLKWERGLFGGKVLSPESLRKMTTPGKGDYGLGLFIDVKNGVRSISHGGGIEGFNTGLKYVPERRLTIVILSNVDAGAPGPMGSQLQDVVLGKPVTLPSERKPVPIAKDSLGRFVGFYELEPGLSLTVAMAGEGLIAQATERPAHAMMYQGVKEGHPRFFLPEINTEIEFVPDSSGGIASLIWHLGSIDMTAKRSVRP